MKNAITKLVVILIKSTKYDRDGYLIQFLKGVLPCNSLAAMWSLTEAAFRAPELAGIECQLVALDETVMRRGVNARELMEQHASPNTRVAVGLVGVQSNMFPRACDIAREFNALGATVVIGGFHVSGAITMLHDGPDQKIPCPHVMPPECAKLMEEGIVIFHGEAEGIWHRVLADIVRGMPQLLYRGGRPPLADAPLPKYPPGYFRGFFGSFHTTDTGRGCPFSCSFCTIINVQGHDPRYRKPADIIARIRTMCEDEGKPFFFFTDDNFARNPQWREILEGLAALRENEGLNFSFMVEADLLAWKLKGFVELLGRAGCSQVFMGVESVRQATLEQTRKRQNQVKSYVEMCELYHSFGVACHAGYIIGFPDDVPVTVAEDIKTLSTIGFDQASFFILTPLPGSEDHARAYTAGVRIDPDLNCFDSFQPVIDHPRMSGDEWQKAYDRAWAQFFSLDHMEVALKRVGAGGYWGLFRNFLWYRWSSLVEKVHPMMAGFWRFKDYRSRRASAPRISYMRHLLREIRRYVEYLGPMAREYYVFQALYFRTCFVVRTPALFPGRDLRERFLSHRAAIQAYAEEWRIKAMRSWWFGKTFGRAAHRDWLDAFWRRYAGRKWRLLAPHTWGWHILALPHAISEMVYAVRFNAVLLWHLAFGA